MLLCYSINLNLFVRLCPNGNKKKLKKKKNKPKIRENIKRFLQYIQLQNIPKTEKNNENLFYYAQYHSFCELLRDVHLLRDFTIQTFQILTVMIKNLKQNIQSHSHLFGNIEDELRSIDLRFKQTCSLPLYQSPILAKLATRTEVIATSLLCAQNACAPQQTAFVCFQCHALSKDMFVLRCFHRFCLQCANYLKSTNQFDCPTCSRHDALTHLEKDEPLRSFISTHFSANLLKQDDQNNNNNNNNNMNNYAMPPSTNNNGNNNNNNNGNIINIKPEPKDHHALIPNHGMQYYNQQTPAYLIPTHQLKTENDIPIVCYLRFCALYIYI